MRYWAGFKDGKLFNETVGCDSGDFLVPALFVSKKVAERERDENKKFDEIRRVEVKPIGSATVLQKTTEPFGTAIARELSTAFLKQLWDSYDGVKTSEESISGEAVHMVLNERGEGKYCAV